MQTAITPEVKENMKAVLADLQCGAFATRFIEDQEAGAPEFKALRAKGEPHPFEATGRELRQLFFWKTSDDYIEGSVARQGSLNLTVTASLIRWLSIE